MTEYTEDEADAIGAANDLAHSFEKRGWQTLESGLAAGYAWVRLGAEAHDDVQAFLAVDPDTNEDRYLYGPYAVTEDMLPAIAEATSRTEAHLLRGMDAHVKGNAPVPPIVPPTSAAHMRDDDAVPPTVPPIEDSHPVADAAHLEDIAKEHIREAGDDHAQQMTYAAVKDQLSSRLWSPVASELSDDVLLKRVVGKEITWRNSVSGKRDSAVVAKDPVKHAAKITRSSLAERPGSTEDLRILHFLEAGGGFRSVAVARIVAIG